MSHPVKVSFRGIEPSEDLTRSAQVWAAAISDGLPRMPPLEATVLIHRCAPQWGASTTVRVDLTIDGRRITEFARCQDPRDAVEGSFIAMAKRLRPASLNRGPVVTPSAIRAWHRDGPEDPSHPF
jgi:hypothetical protein